MPDRIPFNQPFHSDDEYVYIKDAFQRNHVSGNGFYTQLCHSFFEEKYGLGRCFLTTSCTDALEMCALLLDIQKGDEIILPSYTFVSTALAFARQGATLRFVDSCSQHPGMDETQIEEKITRQTKAIVVVHYAGIACNMDYIMEIASRYNLVIIEDAAQCIESFYNGKPLGSIGHLGCFSFHETKNIHCGEGGMLVVNDKKYIARAEKIWEKGTNRAEYFRNQVNKYEWVDTGSSFLPSDILAAMLFAQVQKIDEIQQKRVDSWNRYHSFFSELAKNVSIGIPHIPTYATCNGHLYWLVCASPEERKQLIDFLETRSIHAVFHYQALHSSAYYLSLSKKKETLLYAELFSERLVRLPLYYRLTDKDVDYICDSVRFFFNG